MSNTRTRKSTAIGLLTTLNTKERKENIVNKAERWERCSGATFEPRNTAFVHFTQTEVRKSEQALIIRDEQIITKDKVEILGVTLDSGLRLEQYIFNAKNPGMRAVLAFKRLRKIPLSVTLQLSNWTVCPSLDYSSVIWASQISTKLQPLLR